MPIWLHLEPKDSWDPEKRRVAGAVRALGVSFAAAILPALAFEWLQGWIWEFASLSVAEAGILLALILNRRGNVEGAARTLIAAGLVAGAGMVFFSGTGYKDLSLLLFPAILTAAALLLSLRAYVIC